MMAKKLRLFKSARFYTVMWKSEWLGSTPDALPDMERVKDMLRYDVAFMSIEHPRIVAFVKYATRDTGMRMHEARPTLARWDSFGVKLEPLVTPAPNFNITSDTWCTYRHPRRSGEATDYKTLERVTAARFFSEEAGES